MTQRTLVNLDEQECLDEIARAHVGRLVFVDGSGPVAIPVNFALDGKDVVIRVEAGTKADVLDQDVAFEVDHIEDGLHAGWSVLLRGRAREVAIDDVAALLRRLHRELPRPWAEGVHNRWIVITPHEITGRRLADPAATWTS